jgi:hypothetical protein
MIPSSQEILYRIYGAWRLARFDASGAQYFDVSPEAALRSFFAAALVAPAFFFANFLALSATGASSDAGTFTVALVFALYYCLLWTAPPVIIYRVCQVIDRESAFFRFLSANNWSSVITVHLSFVMAILHAGGLLPEALAGLLSLAVYAYVLGYQWFITRHCLDVSPLAAVGFVALHFVLGFLIESIGLGIVFQPDG